MLTIKEAEERAGALVEAAISAGASAADALYVGDASTGVQVRLGKVENVERSEGEEVGLRLFVGQRSATVSSSRRPARPPPPSGGAWSRSPSEPSSPETPARRRPVTFQRKGTGRRRTLVYETTQ